MFTLRQFAREIPATFSYVVFPWLCVRFSLPQCAMMSSAEFRLILRL